VPSTIPSLPIAVLVSGGGTTLRNLIEKIVAGELPVEIRIVISSNPAAKGLEFARGAGVPTLVVERRGHPDAESFSRAIFEPCRRAGVELVVMGGFLKHVLIPDDFAGRVVNIHPSLIPRHCGHGMYGHHVHAAAIASGDMESGCTVHLVDNHYDQGPILLQRRVPILPGDTPETLAARVFAAECEAYPEAIRLLVESRS
jgi:phosphoribosylglycinamide formyltransferase-1